MTPAAGLIKLKRKSGKWKSWGQKQKPGVREKLLSILRQQNITLQTYQTKRIYFSMWTSRAIVIRDLNTFKQIAWLYDNRSSNTLKSVPTPVSFGKFQTSFVSTMTSTQNKGWINSAVVSCTTFSYISKHWAN